MHTHSIKAKASESDSIFVNIFLQDFHANNGDFLIRAGTSSSHAADPVLLRLVQFYNGNSILHAAFQVIYGVDRNPLQQFHFMNGINCILLFMKWTSRNRTGSAACELEVPALI